MRVTTLQDCLRFRVVMLVIAMLGVQLFMTSPAPLSTVSFSMSRTSGEDRIHLPADYFTENAGQLRNEDVFFYSSSGGLQVGFAERSVLIKIVEDPPPSSDPFPHGMSSIDVEGMRRGVLIRITFQGANPVEPQGRYELPHRSNFFLGNDPSKWQTDVRNYREIVYEDLYDSIDLSYRAEEKGLKYEFLLRPGADVGSITMAYEGVESMEISGGNLVAHTAIDDLQDSAPYAYQEGKEVRCSFILRTLFSQGFECDDWDTSRSLVIDPLVYSTFLGGGGNEVWLSVAVDAAGNAYVTGDTYSIDFPATPGSFDESFDGNSDVFIAKLSAEGEALVYSTFLGGSKGEWAHGSIAVDYAGSVHVTGETMSTDFPTTPGALDTSFNGMSDVFVAKLNASGNALVYATYLGGNSADQGLSLTLDTAGNAYFTGVTMSTDFPTTPGAFDTSHNGMGDVFVAKLNASGNALVYATYLGGSDDENGRSIVLNEDGDAYIAGEVRSADYPTSPGALDKSLNGTIDAFVTRLDAAGSSVPHSTFLGGSGLDLGIHIELDAAADAYVTGLAQSTDFPTTPGAFDTSHNGGFEDAFVAKLDATLSILLYSTFLGGSGDDGPSSAAIDESGGIYVAGRTDSPDFQTTLDAFDTSFNGGSDAYVAKLDATLSILHYSTFLGGSGSDVAGSITLDATGSIYVSGSTISIDFPVTPGAFDTSHNGGYDAFVVKLKPVMPDLEVTHGDISFDPPGPVTFATDVTINATVHNIGDDNASQVVVRFHDGPPSGSNQIGSDQIIPFITYFGGTGFASVLWTAGPPGMHGICVVADPDNSVMESNETNNIACVPMEVFGPPPPRPPTNLSAVLSGKDSQNVTLAWDLSPDDGGGASNVVAYDIHRNTSFDSRGQGYVLYDSIPSGVNTYVDVLAGEGDPSNHFYYVCAISNASLSSCTMNQAGKFTRPLSKGPNLVSTPLIQSDESIETVLQTVEYDRTWHYDTASQRWRWHMTCKEYRRGLHDLNHAMGLWINVTQISNLTVAGIVPAQTMIRLYQGWNLVSFPSFNSSHTVYDLKMDTGAVRVEGYDSAPPYYLRKIGDAEVLQAGYAYWVKVEADEDWVVEVS